MERDDMIDWENEEGMCISDAERLEKVAKGHIIGDEVKVWRKATEKFQKVREFQKEREELIPEYANLNAMVVVKEEEEEEEEEQLRESKQELFDLRIRMLRLEKDTCIADEEGKTEWAEYERLTGGKDEDVEKLKKEAREAKEKGGEGKGGECGEEDE